MKKIKTIRVGHELFLAWTSSKFVIGRPRRGRHLTMTWDRQRLGVHLTNEKLPHGDQKRNQHLAEVRFDVLERLGQAWRDAAVEAFLEGLVPVEPDGLAEYGFKIASGKKSTLSLARILLKRRHGSTLTIRNPSGRDLIELDQHFLGSLVEPSHLDSLRDSPPGTLSAVLVEEGEFVGSFHLFYYPHGARRRDGAVLEPGWYAQLHPELMHQATAKVLLEFAGSRFFGKVERAIRFLGFDVPISSVELEDIYRRVAAGEPIEQIRAERACRNR